MHPVANSSRSRRCCSAMFLYVLLVDVPVRSALHGVPLSSLFSPAFTSKIAENTLAESRKFRKNVDEFQLPLKDLSLQRHGTTTIALLTKSGIIIAVDSRYLCNHTYLV